MKLWVDIKKKICRFRNVEMRRVDVKDTVCRLKNRHAGDSYAVDDALDLLCYIDDSYFNETPFLIQALAVNDDDEVLNFIICILKIMSNTLNEKIITILNSKIDLIISKDNDDYYTTLYYIFDYFALQGKQYQEIIKPLLLKITSCNVPSGIRQKAFAVMEQLNQSNTHGYIR